MKTNLIFGACFLLASQAYASATLPFPYGSNDFETGNSSWISGPGDGVASLIESANKNGKAVFLVVFDKTGTEKDKAVNIAKEATAKSPNTAQVVELNTLDAENSGLIAKYRLSGAPLPLILVIDKHGTAAGGFVLAQATSEGLLKAIPSPKYSEILQGLSAQKSVLVVAYKESMAKKAEAITKCNEAIQLMTNGITVELNMDNKEEASLMNNLKVNKLATEPIIYTVNKLGQVTGNFSVTTPTSELVSAANKTATSGCGPKGCAPGTSCAPAKK